MLLTGLAFRPSDLHVTNDALIDAVLEHSPIDGAAAVRLRGGLRRLLDYSGAQARYWTRARDTIGPRIVDALDAALARAGRRREDVDLLISTSVDRSVLEPAHAYNLTVATALASTSAPVCSPSAPAPAWRSLLRGSSWMAGRSRHLRYLRSYG